MMITKNFYEIMKKELIFEKLHFIKVNIETSYSKFERNNLLFSYNPLKKI